MLGILILSILLDVVLKALTGCWSMSIWRITVYPTPYLAPRKCTLPWIGPREPVYVLVQLVVFRFFMRMLNHVLSIAISRGYLAPEYVLLGQLTRKADIYSFGVLTLEIISGRSSSNCAWGPDLKNLLEWTYNLREEDRLLDIVDPELVEYPEDEVSRFIMVALFCTQEDSRQRPSMKDVLEMLLSDGNCLDVKSQKQPDVVKETDHNHRYASSSSGNC